LAQRLAREQLASSREHIYGRLLEVLDLPGEEWDEDLGWSDDAIDWAKLNKAIASLSAEP
jgi:hypothetical protein